MKRFLNCIVVSILIFISVYGLVSYINPYQLFRLDPNRHDIVSTQRQESKHTICYGLDPNEAELFYLNLQRAFGAEYVNTKVTIYRARPVFPAGQIGTDTLINLRYYGVYKNNVIIYDGNGYTLLHELAHFFYQHMAPHHKDEVFARLTQGYTELLSQYSQVLVLLHDEEQNAAKIQ